MGRVNSSKRKRPRRSKLQLYNNAGTLSTTYVDPNSQLVHETTSIIGRDVSDLLQQLTSPDPLARELALVAAGAYFCNPSTLTDKFLESDGSLEAIVDSLHVSGSDFVGVRRAASDTLNSIVEFLDVSKVILMVKGLNVVECCIGGLVEDSLTLKANIDNDKSVETSMGSIESCFKLLSLFCQFDELSKIILPCFESKGPNGTLKDVTFTFAAGLPNSSLGLPNSPRSPASIMAYAAATKFIAAALQAIQTYAEEWQQSRRIEAIQQLSVAFQPCVATLHDISTQIKSAPFKALSSPMGRTDPQCNTTVLTMWSVNLIDAIIRFIELANFHKSFDASIHNFPITLEQCVPLLLSYVSPEPYLNVSKLLTSIESAEPSSANEADTQTTSANTPTSDTFSKPTQTNDLHLNKGEKFEDGNEIALSKQVDASLSFLIIRLIVTAHSLQLLDRLTDAGYLEIQIMGALDAMPPLMLTGALRMTLQNEEAFNVIMTTLDGAMKAMNDLALLLPTFTSSAYLWELFISLVDALRLLFHFCGSLFSAKNIPDCCVNKISQSDVINGPLSAILNCGKLLQTLLQPLAEDKLSPPLNVSLLLIELLEANVHLATECISSLPSPLSFSPGSSETENVQMVTSSIIDFLQTPTSSLVEAVATMTGKKPTKNPTTIVDDEDDEMDKMPPWKTREFDECRSICESIWPDVQQQMAALMSFIGTRWKTVDILRVILTRSLILLEERTSPLTLRAAVLDLIFDIFGDEEFDVLFIETCALKRLEEIWKRARVSMKKMTKSDEDARFQVQAAVQNLQAFISYKKLHLQPS